jgi:putative endonuclease
VNRKNYWVARREIDLLARKGTTLVAVEVRLRRGDRFGSAIQSVDGRKIARIRFALEGVLEHYPGACGLEPRIDLVVIDVSDDLSHMDVRHIEGIH